MKIMGGACDALQLHVQLSFVSKVVILDLHCRVTPLIISAGFIRVLLPNFPPSCTRSRKRILLLSPIIVMHISYSTPNPNSLTSPVLTYLPRKSKAISVILPNLPSKSSDVIGSLYIRAVLPIPLPFTPSNFLRLLAQFQI